MIAKELCSIPVKSVMTKDIITVKEDTILKEVSYIFQKELIHHIPVIDKQGKCCGMISKSDFYLLLDWGTKLKLPASLRKNNFLLTSNLANDMMEENLMIIKPDDPIGKCVDIFKENYFHALPVTDDEGVLVGLITTYDLMILAYCDQKMLERG